MPQTSQDATGTQRGLSRRAVVRGGLSVAVGAMATLLAVRDGSAAATPLDVKRQSTDVEDTDSTSTTTSKGGGKNK